MVKWLGRQFQREVEAANRKALKKAGALVASSVKESFGDTGIPGATKGQRHANRSKPGEPPHVDTGVLKRSIHYKVVDAETVLVGSNVKYAHALEYGFEPRRLRARPYLRPAVIRERANILKAFKDIL